MTYQPNYQNTENPRLEHEFQVEPYDGSQTGVFPDSISTTSSLGEDSGLKFKDPYSDEEYENSEEKKTVRGGTVRHDHYRRTSEFRSGGFKHSNRLHEESPQRERKARERGKSHQYTDGILTSSFGNSLNENEHPRTFPARPQARTERVFQQEYDRSTRQSSRSTAHPDNKSRGPYAGMESGRHDESNRYTSRTPSSSRIPLHVSYVRPHYIYRNRPRYSQYRTPSCFPEPPLYEHQAAVGSSSNQVSQHQTNLSPVSPSIRESSSYVRNGTTNPRISVLQDPSPPPVPPLPSLCIRRPLPSMERPTTSDYLAGHQFVGYDEYHREIWRLRNRYPFTGHT